MAKFSGTIRRSDLEGGHLQLECSDGSIYVLEGKSSVVQGLVADQRVEIEGAIDRNVMSLAMTGPTLRVTSVKKV
jgi:hypothetical protein